MGYLVEHKFQSLTNKHVYFVFLLIQYTFIKIYLDKTKKCYQVLDAKKMMQLHDMKVIISGLQATRNIFVKLENAFLLSLYGHEAGLYKVWLS